MTINFRAAISMPIVLVAFQSCQGPSVQPATNPPADSDSSAYWALLPFSKVDSANPILQPGDGRFMDPIRHQTVYWERKDVFNPAIVVRDNKVYMLYRAQDSIGKPSGTSRIGLAVSSDGLHFTRQPAPVLYPDHDAQMKWEWEGGCEDPRVVEDDQGLYYMTYTAYDGDKARLMIATSSDLLHWVKKGHAFAKAYNGKYVDEWSKSGSILSRYEQGKIIATRLNGKYWMYWGDQFIWAATSDDLVNWTPVEMQPGEQPPVPLRGLAQKMPLLKVVIPTRAKKFDSDLVESGPPAMITDKGILLIFNSRNVPGIGDSSLPEGTYAASQVLLDKQDPTKILHRMDHYFIRPDKPYETTGQVNQVCFVEGLARFRDKWFLYYGTADSRIAVAVNP
ncbi:MAG: glycoside hydrolase family 130 protein [Bacteroidota bacterium]|nr:glycoside hydrolase family 130 protein [Bacteroidota bacterium]MDP4215964.1 glycoside hydrolase family 130 protein [Bacteroidota bacterium]MDP4246267.1 glycoside hydrolase family 130 protein [Bacteroidota bacterium]MDP4254417.1 glycoside hydrolase family 130 protein [Bacteroidota bacterium]MDP4257847.1 glycoside hydrolase family 130 protein [Bacteroidota bacterium]